MDTLLLGAGQLRREAVSQGASGGTTARCSGAGRLVAGTVGDGAGGAIAKGRRTVKDRPSGNARRRVRARAVCGGVLAAGGMALAVPCGLEGLGGRKGEALPVWNVAAVARGARWPCRHYLLFRRRHENASVLARRSRGGRVGGRDWFRPSRLGLFFSMSSNATYGRCSRRGARLRPPFVAARSGDRRHGKLAIGSRNRRTSFACPRTSTR